jgi:hypothetical protein
MKIIDVRDNFLDQEDFNKLQKLLLGQRFPWFFNDSILINPDNDIYDSQFTHMFFMISNGYEIIRSDFFDNLSSIIKKLSIDVLFRIKANLKTPTEKNIVSGYHTDMPDAFNITTAIYYLNNTDGYTIFKSGEKVESVANRMVTFPSSTPHSSVSCTDCKSRVVINFNYFGL